jgi:hypothetical protein
MRSKTTLGIAGSLATALLGAACGPVDDDCTETARCTTGVDAAVQSRTTAPARTDAATAPVALAPDEEEADAAVEAVAPTCETRRADPTLGVFVAPSRDGGAADGAVCGRQSSPCATIGAALEQARAAGLANVYLAPGTYTANVQLAAGIAIEGGWLEGTWAPDCVSATPAAVVEGAAAGATVAVKEIGGKAALRYVSIRSRPHESLAPGESAYGVLAAGASTQLELDHVVVAAADAADGAAGTAPHLPPMPPSAGCAPFDTGADNTNEGAAGATHAGNVTADGYVAGDGSDGDAGPGPGENGTPASGGTCYTGYYTGHCIWIGIGTARSCAATPRAMEMLCASAGRAGCGGLAGAGGRGGKGGGSSIALYAWEANVVVRDSKLLSARGGAGGPGGRGGFGGVGGAGVPGAPAYAAAEDCSVATSYESCTALNTSHQIAGGVPGGVGGRGAPGGKGGGGSGGHSHAVFHFGTVPLVLAGSDLAVGAAGLGADGAPSGVSASISDSR